ncbi:hypothetical protein ACK8OR_15535 [Jannaschia sp. KMU-145]|uniref:hypothetical protein n=1 Tax=Jannaschia halovivens TaxID=3388667 RepID=UPI00396B338E
MIATTWDDLLQKGETILWQGRPDPRWRPDLPIVAMASLGLVFAGVAVAVMVIGSRTPGPWWLIGVIFLLPGLGLTLWALIGDSVRLAGTVYTLTNRRGFIATEPRIGARRLRSYAITPEEEVELIDGDPPTVLFAREAWQRRDPDGQTRTRQRRIGFERIAEAAAVHRLIVRERDAMLRD